MTVHVLKTISPYFEAVADGSKTFEIRRNDRSPAYVVGDALLLRHHPLSNARAEVRIVTYVTDYPEALKPGHVVLGMRAPSASELVDVLDSISRQDVSR